LDRHKRIPCTNCGKLIEKNKTGLCLNCYNLTQTSNNKYCKICGKQIRSNTHTGLCLEHYEIARKENKIPPREYIRKIHHKVVLCSKCGKQIGENKTGLCINCYSLDIRKRHAEIHKKEEIRHVNTVNMQASKLFKNYHPNPCKKSPSGYHHWLINSQNVGTCFYCDHSERMPELREKRLGVK
jgi:hypothetical protein